MTDGSQEGVAALPASDDPESKEPAGVQKFAESLIIGSISFVYSIVITTWLAYGSKLASFEKLQTKQKAGGLVLPSRVFMLIGLLAVQVLDRVNSKTFVGDRHALHDIFEFSGASWWQQILATIVSYIIIDIALLLILRSAASSDEERKLLGERMRYAAGASAIVLTLGIAVLAAITFGMRANLSDYSETVILFGDFRVNLVAVAALVILLIAIVPSASAVRLALGRHADRVGAMRGLVLTALGAAIALALGFGALYAANIAYRASGPYFDPDDLTRVQDGLDASNLACVLRSDWQLFVTAPLRNKTGEVFVIAPDQFAAYLSTNTPTQETAYPRSNVGEMVLLRPEKDFPAILNPSESTTLNLSGKWVGSYKFRSCSLQNKAATEGDKRIAVYGYPRDTSVVGLETDASLGRIQR